MIEVNSSKDMNTRTSYSSFFRPDRVSLQSQEKRNTRYTYEDNDSSSYLGKPHTTISGERDGLTVEYGKTFKTINVLSKQNEKALFMEAYS